MVGEQPDPEIRRSGFSGAHRDFREPDPAESIVDHQLDFRVVGEARDGEFLDEEIPDFTALPLQGVFHPRVIRFGSGVHQQHEALHVCQPLPTLDQKWDQLPVRLGIRPVLEEQTDFFGEIRRGLDGERQRSGIP